MRSASFKDAERPLGVRTFRPSRVIAGVGWTDRLRQLAQAFFFPQSCALCGMWVCNPDFSPLCRGCLHSFPVVIPPICSVCGVPLPGHLEGQEGLCSRCRAGAWSFDIARSYGLYTGTLRVAVQRFKFEGRRRMAAPLADLLERTLARNPLPFGLDRIVPVPLHPSRRRERGYDQTRLLAEALASRLGVPVFRGLARIRHTRPQYGLDAGERRRNLRGAFRLAGGADLEGLNLLLVDDVLTTGTTVEELARLIRRKAAPRTLLVLTVARVPLVYC